MFKVLIAVDGSEPSKRAIEAVARLAERSAAMASRIRPLGSEGVRGAVWRIDAPGARA